MVDTMTVIKKIYYIDSYLSVNCVKTFRRLSTTHLILMRCLLFFSISFALFYFCYTSLTIFLYVWVHRKEAGVWYCIFLWYPHKFHSIMHFVGRTTKNVKVMKICFKFEVVKYLCRKIIVTLMLNLKNLI